EASRRETRKQTPSSALDEPLEYARLMGASDYNLTGARTNQALFAFGDAVAVPAVEWLGKNYLMPLTKGSLVSGMEQAAVVQ
ncbi:hypothetical protein, partial [Staphylococcus aureus]